MADQVAIVTGSATGIGAATALALSARGAKVVVNYTKSKAEAEATAHSIRQQGGEALLIQADVASNEDCRRMAETTQAQWGRIDVLVNNAGTTKFAAHHDLDALNAEDFLNIYRVNVVGAFQMIRACAPALRTRGGSVVNVSSIAGVYGVGSSVAYAASKGAMNTMTLSLARALAPEIRVNAICPAFVETRWFGDRFGKEAATAIAEQQRQVTPLKRAGSPADIADAIAFFASPASRHITGEQLLLDAGHHLALAGLNQR
ncbi:MAG TPA: oxidoreductase [Alphaproteobacteria bacterium]|nr:oxidoreductase [Alphaproteobacteria bacterium]